MDVLYSICVSLFQRRIYFAIFKFHLQEKKSFRINFDILYFEALLLLLLLLGLFANKHTIHVTATVESCTGHKIN